MIPFNGWISFRLRTNLFIGHTIANLKSFAKHKLKQLSQCDLANVDDTWRIPVENKHCLMQYILSIEQKMIKVQISDLIVPKRNREILFFSLFIFLGRVSWCQVKQKLNYFYLTIEFLKARQRKEHNSIWKPKPGPGIISLFWHKHHTNTYKNVNTGCNSKFREFQLSLIPRNHSKFPRILLLSQKSGSYHFRILKSILARE